MVHCDVPQYMQTLSNLTEHGLGKILSLTFEHLNCVYMNNPSKIMIRYYKIINCLI